MIKLMIVDDSGFMRMALRKMLEKNASIVVVAEASSGEEALRLAKQHRPDAITMDVEMPGGGGIEATRKIMQECPTVIIMVSSITSMGADATIKAMSYGAVDYIPKASSFVSLDITQIEDKLLRKIFYWVENWKEKTASASQKAKEYTADVQLPKLDIKPKLIVIGASTGGPKILPEIFEQVKKIQTPIVVALHMPPLYTESFAKHMAAKTGHNIIEGKDDLAIEKDMVVIAPGGMDSLIMDGREGLRLKVVKPKKEYSIHPSVDCLFKSAIGETKKVAGIILSGMGDDGLNGAIEFSKYGLPVVAQDAESSLVYGMPRVVIESGLATSIQNIAGIARTINKWAAV